MTSTTETAVAVRDASPAASMTAKIAYAKALAESGLLPKDYRLKPANVLYAVEYGDMLGLSPMAAITGIHIIEGKPSASAGLISALVRRAGHKLRVTGDSKSATCRITRCDDPDYTFEVTFTMADAQTAGLTGKTVWKQYGASMLKARAITQCARDACEEALYGLHYTPEELGAEVNEEGNVVGGTIVDEPPAADPVVTGAADPWATPVAADPDWYAGVLERAAAADSEDDCRGLWAELAEGRKAGKCSAGEATAAAEVITARVEDIRKPADVVEGVIVDPPAVEGLAPEDPWTDKVQSITSSEDVAAAFADVNGSKSMTRDRKDQVTAAIRAREASLLTAASA